MRQQTPIITNEKNMPIFPTHLRHTADVSMYLLERLWRKGATPPGRDPPLMEPGERSVRCNCKGLQGPRARTTKR